MNFDEWLVDTYPYEYARTVDVMRDSWNAAVAECVRRLRELSDNKTEMSDALWSSAALLEAEMKK